MCMFVLVRWVVMVVFMIFVFSIVMLEIGFVMF